MTENDRLAELPLPPASRLRGRSPQCAWCSRPVDEWGYTCDHRCWEMWVEKILPTMGAGDVVSTSSVQHPPLPDWRQPWYIG